MNAITAIEAPPAPTIHPETLLRLPAVVKLTGLSRASIYRRIAKGSFPRPVSLGDHVVAWPAGRLFEWARGLPDVQGRGEG